MAKSKAPETKPARKEEEKKTESSKDKKSIKGDLDAMFKSTKSKAIKKNKPEVKAEPAKKPTFEKDEKKKGGRTKYTQEGYKIYSAAELKLGQGGDTADCPFDCDCCF